MTPAEDCPCQGARRGGWRGPAASSTGSECPDHCEVGMLDERNSELPTTGAVTSQLLGHGSPQGQYMQFLVKPLLTPGGRRHRGSLIGLHDWWVCHPARTVPVPGPWLFLLFVWPKPQPGPTSVHQLALPCLPPWLPRADDVGVLAATSGHHDLHVSPPHCRHGAATAAGLLLLQNIREAIGVLSALPLARQASRELQP